MPCENGRDYLIDYLAIYPDKRDIGFGSALIKLLSDYMAGSGNIIGEVEDPDYAKDEEDRKHRIINGIIVLPLVGFCRGSSDSFPE